MEPNKNLMHTHSSAVTHILPAEKPRQHKKLCVEIPKREREEEKNYKSKKNWMINDCFQRFFLFLCQSFSMFCVAREVYAIGGLGSQATARPPQSAARLPNEFFPTSRARSHVPLGLFDTQWTRRASRAGGGKRLKMVFIVFNASGIAFWAFMRT